MYYEIEGLPEVLRNSLCDGFKLEQMSLRDEKFISWISTELPIETIKSVMGSGLKITECSVLPEPPPFTRVKQTEGSTGRLLT